ncbi:STAS/SEC14 domain-containing protein [Mycolicibacterium sp. P1-5]|uniref:STAS/SEC14 domain-containing protein n=1 Tax=Mycolicibacterium sp. P1-5 TaxID=2024617 RepID=UPI0011F03256|nr:STAS/SEC14 domain-containing protein [Mycolicibacterium sp. P1-5]KAA0104141.1 STAS/SEC14 domain-containing protein [Mycolicibacterium sp. P1-5]
MIEVLSDMPQGVTGIRVSGRVSGDDLKAFKPTMDELLKAGGDIRIVEVIDSDYQGFGPGGLVEDLKLGLGTLFSRHSAFKRVAVVSDKEWVAHTIHVVGWLIPGEVAVFGLDGLEQAKQWAAG